MQSSSILVKPIFNFLIIFLNLTLFTIGLLLFSFIASSKKELMSYLEELIILINLRKGSPSKGVDKGLFLFLYNLLS
jgi:hypothetical protein